MSVTPAREYIWHSRLFRRVFAEFVGGRHPAKNWREPENSCRAERFLFAGCVGGEHSAKCWTRRLFWSAPFLPQLRRVPYSANLGFSLNSINTPLPDNLSLIPPVCSSTQDIRSHGSLVEHKLSGLTQVRPTLHVISQPRWDCSWVNPYNLFISV